LNRVWFGNGTEGIEPSGFVKTGNVFEWGSRDCVPWYSVGTWLWWWRISQWTLWKKKPVVCCEAVWSGKHVSTFQKSLLPP
jgi:hypothetical protein